MKAAIRMVEDVATSAKVFDLVFQPLLYGYLDLDEINEKNKQDQNPLGLLVDGLKLADKMQAASVVSLIQEELGALFDGPGSVTIGGIKKLFEARPMTDNFLFRYLSHGASLSRNPKVLQVARQKVTGFTEFEHTYLRLSNSEEARNVEKQEVIEGVETSEEMRNYSLEVNADPADNEIANKGGGGDSDHTADAEPQSESTIKHGKRPAQETSPSSPTNNNEEDIEANAKSTAEPEQLQDRMLNDPAATAQASQQIEATEPQLFTAPTTPEAHKASTLVGKSNMKQPVGNGRGSRGTKRKVAFDNEPQIHPISSPVDVPSLPKPAIIDLKEGPPSRRLRQRGPDPSDNTPEPQHDDNVKAIKKKPPAFKGSKKAVPPKDVTKASDIAKSRAKATSKTQGRPFSTPSPDPTTRAPAKAATNPLRKNLTLAMEDADKRRGSRSKAAR